MKTINYKLDDITELDKIRRLNLINSIPGFKSANLIVGKILDIRIPENILLEDGSLDLSEAGTVAISGLDNYYATKKIIQLGYARP